MEKLFCIFQEVCEINTVLPESIDERIALYEKHLQHPIVMTLEEYHEYSQLYQSHIEKARQCRDADAKHRIIRYELPAVCYSATLWNQTFGVSEAIKLRGYNSIVALDINKEQALEYMIFRLSSFDFVLYASESADGKDIIVLVLTDCPCPSSHKDYFLALKSIFQGADLAVSDKGIDYMILRPIGYSKGAYINFECTCFKLIKDNSETYD